MIFQSETEGGGGGWCPSATPAEMSLTENESTLSSSVNREGTLRQKGTKHWQGLLRHFQRNVTFHRHPFSSYNVLTDRQTFPTALMCALYATTTNRRHVLLNSSKAYRKRNTGTAPPILNTGTRWLEWSVSRPVRTTSAQGPSDTPILNRRFEEPRANMHALRKGKNLPCRELNDSSDISP